MTAGETSSQPRRCVVVGGASIADYEAAKQLLRQDDFIIYCDSGLRHERGLGADASLIIGDFDSHPRPDIDTEIIELPRAKDDTDSVFAVKEALGRGFTDFLLLGMTGGRIDHTLCNVYILIMIYERGASALLVDDFSDMEIVGAKPALIPDSYPYFSLLNISGTSRGVTIKNAKFPLDDAEITCGYQYGISNEPLNGMTASVSVKEGCMLLVRVREPQPCGGRIL